MAEKKPEYVAIEQVETDGRARLDVAWDLLVSNMRWMQSNADRFGDSRVHMTTLADSLTKTADQMLDVIKEESGSSRITPEMIEAMMRGSGEAGEGKRQEAEGGSRQDAGAPGEQGSGEGD